MASWIGTGGSNPGDVQTDGFIYSSGAGKGFDLYGSSSSYQAKLFMHGTDNDLCVRSYYSSSGKRRLLFQQQDSAGISNRMCINTSGYVGISTDSPSSMLEVNGGDIEVDDSANGLILRD
jgi:hypothetical protein